MAIKIFIPTIKRLDKQRTWEMLPARWRKHAALVCPPEEVADHAARGRRAIPCAAVGIASTRDFIIDFAHKQGIKKVLMLDDDLTPQYVSMDGRIVNSTEAEFNGAMGWMDQNLGPKQPHASWAPRFLSYTQTEDQRNMRAMYALGYHVPTIKKHGLSFRTAGDFGTMEDFHMTLQLFEKGLANVVSARYRISPYASNAEGGCSTWRTTSGQTESARWMEKRWPGVVKVRPKKEWRGMEEGMLDVTVYWKKAAKLGGVDGD